MTYEEFDDMFDSGEFNTDYANFIMDNCHGDRLIGNGDALIAAMEDGYLFEEFRETCVNYYVY